jgi:Uma2 family endonuclease
MLKTLDKSLTLDEFLQLPETKPASEYVNGQIIQKPMPQGEHSTIQSDFTTAINNVVKSKQIARAYTELRCTFGGRSIVPDIAVFIWNRIPRNENGRVANKFLIAPDWTIEILSPDQSLAKVIKNILHCLQHGTQIGWLIDPEEETIFVFQPHQETQVFDKLDAVLTVPTFANELILTVRDVFAWLWD